MIYAHHLLKKWPKNVMYATNPKKDPTAGCATNTYAGRASNNGKPHATNKGKNQTVPSVGLYGTNQTFTLKHHTTNPHWGLVYPYTVEKAMHWLP